VPDIDSAQRLVRSRTIRHFAVLLAVAPVLATSIWASASGAEREAVELRVYSKSEIVGRLRSVGVVDEPTELVRLPKADGVRIRLFSGDLVELRCDGSVERREMRSRKTYFDSGGRPFAWYEGQTLRFSESSVGHEVGNAIAVDPEGRYLVTTDGPSPGKETRVYATGQLASPLGSTPLAGNHTRVFSSAERLILVGDAPAPGKGAIAIVYDVSNRALVERERVDVPMPDTWFGGWLVAEDATPDTGEILFGFWRDPPLSHQLYVFDLAMRKIQHVSKLRGYHAYVACDPIATRYSDGVGGLIPRAEAGGEMAARSRSVLRADLGYEQRLA